MAIKVTVKEAQTWFKNERKQLVFPVLDSAGAPVDVTLWAVTWALMKKAGAAEFIAEKDRNNGITVENGTEGQPNTFVVTIDEPDLNAARANVELYQELKRTDVPNVLAYGPVTLLPSGI